MNRVLLASAVALALAGCNSAPPPVIPATTGVPATVIAAENKAETYQASIKAGCDFALLVAPIAGPVAPWIVGGCGTEEAIAKLALDRSSLEWLNGLIAKTSALI